MVFYHQYLSVRSPLLLRTSPNTFAFIPIPSMSPSSRNCSNSKAFRHILPCVAPVCEGMHYHKTGVPWQMNNTFIKSRIISQILIYLSAIPISLSSPNDNCSHFLPMHSVLPLYFIK